MDATEGWAIVVVLVALYVVAILALRRTGRLGKDRAFSLFGPALMVKTVRGRTLLDRIGRFRRFWSAAGDLGIALAVAAMSVIMAVLVLGAYVATRVPAGSGPSPQEALGIPGINPIIPLGYGLVALIVGVVLHELAHGIVARSQKIGVKSLGILWLVIPIGAFVEQDDAEMQGAPRRHRDRVAAAGVLANFGLTVVFFLLLAGLFSTSVAPNANGVGLAYIYSGTPAANGSLRAGDIITSVNGTATPDEPSLAHALSLTHPGQQVSLTYYSASKDRSVTTSVELTALSTFTGSTTDANRSALGVGITFLTPVALRNDIVDPAGADGGPLVGVIAWVVLPLAGLEPIAGPTASFYHITGPAAALGSGGFWILANLLYWLCWMNLLLGLSNALPLFPLDGGLLFRDFVATIGSRLKRGWDAQRLDRIGGRALAASSALVLVLLVWQFVAPHF